MSDRSFKILNREELIAMGEQLRTDALAERYMNRIYATNMATLRDPEDVLGHRLLLIARTLLEGTDNATAATPEDCAPEDRWEYLTLLPEIALAATPHLWTAAAWGKLWDLRLPAHVVSPRALPLPIMWHTFTDPCRVSDDEHLFALLINDGVKCICVTEFWVVGGVSDGAGFLEINQFNIPYGKAWPGDFAGEDGVNGKVEATLQLLAFLSSPYIPRTQERMSRAARREISRRGSQVDPEDEVTFVLLRRVGAGRHEKSETAAEIEWKHRWLVTGHLRAQWYPSESAHHLIWIAPYMKGPEDAPLLEHVYKVAR